MVQNSNNKGITLVALVITIVILIILATVTINFTFGDDGIITKANQAKYMAELSTFQEELGLYKANKQISEEGFNVESLTAGEESLSYTTSEGLVTEGTIYDVITSLIGSSFAGKMEIIKGELLINSQDIEEIKIAQSMGIKVNPYVIENGELKSDGANLALMDKNGSLTIPEGVTVIGEGAFADLSGLKTIIIPGTVKEIKGNAFRNNVDLENVIMKEGIKTIGNYVFQKCNKLRNVELPESIENIGTGAFYICSNLQEIKIPDKVTVINNLTFAHCTSLTKVELSNNIYTIGDRSFYNCNLTEITLPKNLKVLNDDVFGRNTNLTTIKIPEENQNFEFEQDRGMLIQNNSENQEKSIVFITDSAIKESNTLDIPEGITNIKLYLQTAYNIKTVNIPSTLKSIEANNLPNSISAIIVDAGNQNYIVEGECLYSKDKKNLIICFTKNEIMSKTDFAEELEIIETRAFKQAENLKKIELPDSVLRIEKYIVIENAILESLTLGEKVEYIDPEFKYATRPLELNISNNNPNYTVENNVLYNKDKTKLISVLYEIDGKYTVEPHVTTIGRYAFENQVKMTEIELPNNLKILENNIFMYCTGLEEIYIPESIEEIQEYSFASVDNLQKIQINKEKGSIAGSPWGAIRGERIVEWLK